MAEHPFVKTIRELRTDVNDALAASGGGSGTTRPATVRNFEETVGGRYLMRDYGVEHRDTAGQAQKLTDRYGTSNPKGAFLTEFPEMSIYDAKINPNGTLAWHIWQALWLRGHARQGGDVEHVAGQTWIDQTIYKPEAGEGHSGTGQRAVGMCGVDQNASYIRATGEFAASDGEDGRAYMITAVNRHTTGAGSVGAIRDVGFVGPMSSFTYGRPNTATSIMGWGSRCKLMRVQFQGGHLGLDITGDHTTFYDCKFQGNTVGVYFRMTNPVLFGDYNFERCTIDNSAIASIVAGPFASIPKMSWSHGITAATPIHLYKEWGGDKAFIAETCKFDQYLFENTGTAYIENGWPITTDPAAPFGRNGDNSPRGMRQGIPDNYFGMPTVNKLKFVDTQFGNLSDFFLPSGWTRDYGFRVGGSFNGFEIDGVNEPGLINPNFNGANAPGIFNFASGVVRLKGAWGFIADDAKTGGKHVFAPRLDWRAAIAVIDDNEGWTGGFYPVWDDSGTVRPLFKYELAQDGTSGSGGALVRADGTAPLVGVVRAEPGQRVASSLYLVRSTGPAPGIVKVEAGTTSGPLMVGSNGQARKWDGTRPMFGTTIGNPFTGMDGDTSGQLYADFRFGGVR